MLTEHQKEVLRSKRRTSNVPAMYNDLSQSSLQSDSLLETQSNDGQSNIVIISTCSLVEKEEEALLEPPCPIKSFDRGASEKTSKNGTCFIRPFFARSRLSSCSYNTKSQRILRASRT